MTSECTSGKGKWMNATGLRAVWMHDHYFFYARVFLGSRVILTRRVTSLIDLYLATGGIGQLKIHENEKTSFSGNRWTKGNLPTSSSVNPTAQLIHVVDGVSLAQTSKEVRFEVWSWWMEKNRQIASRTDKGSSTGLMIVREHLGTLLIAGEREREKWIHYRKQLLLSSNRVSLEWKWAYQRICWFDQCGVGSATKWPLPRLCSDYVPIAKGFLLNFEKSTNRGHVDRLDSDFPDGIFGGSPHIFSVSEWEKECTWSPQRPHMTKEIWNSRTSSYKGSAVVLTDEVLTDDTVTLNF